MTASENPPSPRRRDWQHPQHQWVLLLSLLMVLLIPCFAALNRPGEDFDRQFYLAAAGWPRPYDAVPVTPLRTGGVYGIFTPMVPVVLQPFGLLPLRWARAIVQAATVTSLLALAGRRWQAGLLTLASAPALLLVFHYANLDAISALGALLPPAGGLFLLLMKPQAAGLAAVAWLAQRRWGALLPAVVVMALVTLLWPEWLARARLAPAGALNVSLFPFSLLLALPLLGYAVKRRDPLLAALATPLAVPYVAFYSLAPTVALLARRSVVGGLVACLASWGLLYWLMQTVN